MPVIDIHSHVIPQTLITAMEAEPDGFGTKIEVRNGKRHVVRAMNSFELEPVMYDPAAKLAAMDRMGLDISVLSAAPPVYCYWLPAAQGIRAAKLINDGIGQMVAARPDRLRGMATLPMQDPDAAIAELERSVKEYKFKGVELATSIEGAFLADPKFRPVLKAIEKMGLFVFTHPYGSVAKAVLNDYYLINLVGFPLDTTLMAAHLMYSGALDELKTLHFILPHGGGYLPYQIGRFAHGHKVRPETRANSATSPFEHLKRFSFDALLHYPQSIRHLIDAVGSDRVMIGSDCPFDMADASPVKTLDAAPRLTAAEREAVTHTNAARLLGEG
jgi:aminocarboxymuconate-semialdehyde decarboxylase